MDGSRHAVAVLSPTFLTAGSPRFKWKSILPTIRIIPAARNLQRVAPQRVPDLMPG
jgi:hypothetical protein